MSNPIESDKQAEKYPNLKRGGQLGRKKGVPNKTTATIREMALAALDAKGGQAYFEKVADEDPKAFMALLGKILPAQVTIEAAVQTESRVCVYLPDNRREIR